MMSRTLRVLFDTEVFAWQIYGGISRYYVELMRALPRHGIEPRLIAPLSFNDYLGKGEVPGYRGLHLPRQGANRWTQRAVSMLLRSTDEIVTRTIPYDVLHHTYYRRKFPHARRMVTTALDMTPEIFPHYFPFGNPHKGKVEAMLSASVIVACSETTKQDLLRIIPGISAPIEVVPLGIDAAFFKRHAVGEEERYVLFVGSRVGYKNFATFAVAMAAVLREEVDLHVLCVGGGGLSTEELRPFVEAGVAGRVKQRPADDAQLAKLYRRALVFVFPSVHEGFGLPILEAFASGCPTALGRSSCFPEVADDAAEYFDPLDAESIAEAVRRLIHDPARRDELRRLGYARLGNFSWDHTAALTAAAYRRAVEEQR